MRASTAHNFISINPVGATTNHTQAYIDDYSHSVHPVSVHSHNDYWRPYPLFSALAAGCSSVEADVWSRADDPFVGHVRKALSDSKTLRTLYVDPLRSILDSINSVGGNTTFNSSDGRPADGVFRTDPTQTLILLIDVKTNATETWPQVVQALQPLRERGYLSSMSDGKISLGPVTIVGSGNIGSSPEVLGSGCAALTTFVDTFLDAPLEKLTDAKNFATLSCGESFLGLPLAKYYVASAPFRRTVGLVNAGFRSSQMETIRSSIQAAAAKNLTSRYWQLPAWPVSLRDKVWSVLTSEGIGLLNADDIESATRLDWPDLYKAQAIFVGVSSAYVVVVTVVLMWLYNRARQ